MGCCQSSTRKASQISGQARGGLTSDSSLGRPADTAGIPGDYLPLPIGVPSPQADRGDDLRIDPAAIHLARRQRHPIEPANDAWPGISNRFCPADADRRE
jgi:hypothetical protein